MRLAQAARKLAITTEDIVSFLAKKNITIVKDSNTKLDENSIELLYSYFGIPEEEAKKEAIEPKEEIRFAPTENEDETSPTLQTDLAEEGPIEDQEEEQPIEDTVRSEEELPIASDEAIKLELSDDLAESETLPEREKKYKTVSDLLEEQENESSAEDAKPEEEIIIKAPKINLKGLNVLGKIDLPEPREKKSTAGEADEKRLAGTSKKEPNRSPKKYQRGKGRKELSPQEIRAKEKRKAENKRRAEEAAKKKQREDYYTENILKPKQTAQKKKPTKRKKPQAGMTEKNKAATKSQPTTVLGKFWKWLNT